MNLVCNKKFTLLEFNKDGFIVYVNFESMIVEASGASPIDGYGRYYLFTPTEGKREQRDGKDLLTVGK